MKGTGAAAWRDSLRALWEKNRLVVLAALAGVVLLLLPALPGGDGGQAAPAPAAEEDPFRTEELESRMEEALSRVAGVGEARVVLTLQSGPRRIVAQDTDSAVRDGESEAGLSTVVVSGGDGGEEAVPLQQMSPQSTGALVVCAGGGDPSVRLRVVEAVSALTGLGADRISVCEGK